jgi:cytochrome c556
MSRLESADEKLAAAVAGKGDFDKQLERVVHEAEMVAAIGEAIQQKDFEFHDDDTYRGYAAAMRDAGVAARDAARKKDYDAARTAVGALKKSCDACHGEYRG